MAKVVDPLEEKLLRAKEEAALHKKKQKEAEERAAKINAAMKVRNQKECDFWLKKVGLHMDKQLKVLGGERYYLKLPIEVFSEELVNAVWEKVTAASVAEAEQADVSAVVDTCDRAEEKGAEKDGN